MLKQSDIRIVRHNGGEQPGGGWLPAHIQLYEYWTNEWLGTCRTEEELDSTIAQILAERNK